MEDKVVRGIRWTMLGYGASRAGSLLTTFVLARLLVPGDFGLVAFSALLIAGLVLFGTLGLASTVVIRQELGRADLGTALTLMIAAYVACAGLVAVVSLVAGDLLDDSRAGGVLRWLAVPVLWGGVTAFYAAVLQRELQFARQFACMSGQVIAVAVTAIPLAATGAGVWSLVAGQVAGAVVYTALLLRLSPYSVRPGFDAGVARSLFRSGWGFMVQGGVSFIEQNADYAVVGTKAGAHQLGLYSMAYRIGEIPNNFVVEPVAQATFPGFARMQSRAQDVGGSFLRTLRLTAVCALPLGVIASGTARPLVASILGADWLGSVGLLQILGLWGGLRVVHATIGWFVNSMGHSARIGKAYAVMLVASIPLLIVAADREGARGVAWVMLANIVVMTAIVSTIAHRRVGVSAWDQWDAVRASALGAVPAWLVSRGVASALSGAPGGVALVVAAGGGLAAFAMTAWLVDRTVFSDARRQLARIVRPGARAQQTGELL